MNRNQKKIVTLSGSVARNFLRKQVAYIEPLKDRPDTFFVITLLGKTYHLTVTEFQLIPAK